MPGDSPSIWRRTHGSKRVEEGQPGFFGTHGGDLFVSVAAQNGGGGADGTIDVLNAAGRTVALYDVGTAAIPIDPRGLLFIGGD